MTGAAAPITALCDAADRLVSADEPLAGLQLRCGGDLPGVIAVPALLALVRQARVSGVAQVRRIAAIDQGQSIAFVAEAAPGPDGTRLLLGQWRLTGAEPSAPDPDALLFQRAALHAVLDAGQAVLAAVPGAAQTAGTAAPLTALRNAWLAAPGKPWSDAVDLPGLAHRQPLHWRLLDDVAVAIPGSTDEWRARILPRGGAGAEPDAFDLLLLPVRPEPPVEPEAAARPAGWSRLVGRDLAPALRQPIQRIIANAETIRTRLAGPLADDYAGYAADIAEAGRHLMGLVDDLADLDAVEAPGFAPAPDAIDLGDCARRAAGILAMRAGERAITLVTPDPRQRAPATGEFRRVLQILLNLLTNAIRYSPEHSRVSVAVGGDAVTAWIAVSDEGEGLSAEQAARVFDKFERLGRTGDGGSGLGLYISRRLARAMGGDLTVTGRGVHGGACFTLTLPGRNEG